MNSVSHLRIEDLLHLCEELEEESLTLEFKSCNELKAGTPFRDKTGSIKQRQPEHVIEELTKD